MKTVAVQDSKGGNDSIVEIPHRQNAAATQQQQQQLIVEEPPRFTFAMLKTIMVSGVGFMTDAYDLFIIGIITPMIAIVYYKGPIDSSGEGLVKAAAAWGTLTGQLLFGYLADKIGRKNLYALVLMMITMGTLASAMAGPTQAVTIIGMLGFWRVFLGVGIGGDYPLAGVITSEFASTKYRGMMIASVFAMQGIGIMLGALVSVIVVFCFQTGIRENPVYYLDCVWRICVGVGAIPGLIGVYYRLQVPESPRYTADVIGDTEQAEMDAAKLLNPDAPSASNVVVDGGEDASASRSSKTVTFKVEPTTTTTTTKKKKKNSSSFTTYFGKWKNLKVLLGTAVTWFALDVGFYGTNLNTPTILKVIGFGGGETVYDQVWNVSLGNLIISLLGSVPGYWFTVYFIEKWGRKPIQYMGFTALIILFGALAIGYDWLKTNSIPMFVAIYTLIQFFNNFGPNATTFVLAGEVFPTRFRATAHGISAASGKLGAIFAAQGFSTLKDIGGPGAFVPNLLWIFAGFMAVGLVFTTFVPETKGISLEDLSENNDDDDD